MLPDVDYQLLGIRAQSYESTGFEQTLGNLSHKSTMDPEGVEETESDTRTLCSSAVNTEITNESCYTIW